MEAAWTSETSVNFYRSSCSPSVHPDTLLISETTELIWMKLTLGVDVIHFGDHLFFRKYWLIIIPTVHEALIGLIIKFVKKLIIRNIAAQQTMQISLSITYFIWRK
jgi:hypothetical protein